MRRARRSHLRLGAAAFALATGLGAVVPGPAASARGPKPSHAFAPGVVLVKIADGTSPAAVARAIGARSIRALEGVRGWHRATVTKASVPRARRLAVPGVIAIEPDYVVSAASTAAEPNDPCIREACRSGVRQWNLDAITAPLAWEAYPGRARTIDERFVNPVTVAVLDTHVDQSHPDFVNAGGWSSDIYDGGQIDKTRARSWVPPDRRAGPGAYHGTFVAGILGAAAGNGTDIAGVGHTAFVLPLTVLDGEGRTTASVLAEAIAYAHASGVRVMNLSLGMESDSAVVRDAIRAATGSDKPVLVVAAAGNNTKDRPFFPGSYPEVMSVAGFDGTGGPAGCSNYNDNVSVAAPARHVVSLAPMPERLRVVDCGTSAAAPHVAGVAALLFAQDPARSPADVRSIIERTAEEAGSPGRDPHFGFGRLDADRALRFGVGPVVDEVRATVPSRGGGSSQITAVARSQSPIRAAEVYLDHPGRASSRVAMEAVDGAFDEPVEEVRVTLSISSGMDAGAHRLFVRASDGTWGATGRGKLLVDRTPPTIGNVRADPTIRGATATVSFTITDEHSSSFAVSVVIRSPDGVNVAYRSPVIRTGAGPLSVQWTPDLLALPGLYRAEIWVWDEAGNPALGSAALLVV